MTTFICEIKTAYKTHPGSNVGSYQATSMGRQKTSRCDQALTSTENHYRAADRLMHVLLGPAAAEALIVETDSSEDGQQRTFRVSKP